MDKMKTTMDLWQRTNEAYKRMLPNQMLEYWEPTANQWGRLKTNKPATKEEPVNQSAGFKAAAASLAKIIDAPEQYTSKWK